MQRAGHYAPRRGPHNNSRLYPSFCSVISSVFLEYSYRLTIWVGDMSNSLGERLLQLLRTDARMSTSELARQLKVSRSTVQSRLQKLEQDDVIHSYTVVLGENFRKGLMRAHVLVAVEQKLTARLNRQIESIPQIVGLHAISGEFDLIVEVEAAGPQALNRILDQISALDGIRRTQTSVILETRFQR